MFPFLYNKDVKTFKLVLPWKLMYLTFVSVDAKTNVDQWIITLNGS